MIGGGVGWRSIRPITFSFVYIKLLGPGLVTGRGIANNIKCLYPKVDLYGVLELLLFANLINIGARIGAMGAAANLLVGGPTLVIRPVPSNVVRRKSLCICMLRRAMRPE